MMCLQQRFLSLGTLDILGQIIVVGIVQCLVGFLVASRPQPIVAGSTPCYCCNNQICLLGGKFGLGWE